MFPGLEQRLRACLDFLVEFSTLGEYRVTTVGGVVPAGSYGVPQGGGKGHRRPRGERCDTHGSRGAPYRVCRGDRLRS